MRAGSATSVLLPVSGLWTIAVCISDADGYAVDGTPELTITLPGGSTDTAELETDATGEYRTEYIVSAGGRHVASVVDAEHGAVDFAAYVTAVTTAAGMPVVDDVADYLREDAASWTEADLQGALNAEAAAQRSVCRVAAVYPDDMREALLRRVQRNLAMRSLPVAVLTGDAEGGSSTLLPGRDPEVRRLEAPHRKLVFG